MTDENTVQKVTPFPTGVFAVDANGASNENLIKQKNVVGNAIIVPWAPTDPGDGKFNWSGIEKLIAPWWAAGKKTALILWAVSDGNNTSTPAYVLKKLPPTVSCASNENVPEFTNENFIAAYSNWLTALFGKYASDERIAYIRVPFGGGGETFPLCMTVQETAYGLTEEKWQAAVLSIIALVKTLAGSVTVQFALDCYGQPCPASGTYDFPAAVAAAAAAAGFGIGQNGFSESDIHSYESGRPTAVNWAAFFAQYPNVFHELQFNTDVTEAQVPGLLEFAVGKANVVETPVAFLQAAFGSSPNAEIAAAIEAFNTAAGK
jgi:hypothetical protein